MSSSEQQRLHEERLQDEIEELRGDLGDTVEALVHKADVPARAKERGNAMRQEAIERGIELQQQAVERGSELLRQTSDAALRARQSVSQTPTDRWAKLAGAGLALLAMTVIVRRMRTW